MPHFVICLMRYFLFILSFLVFANVKADETKDTVNSKLPLYPQVSGCNFSEYSTILMTNTLKFQPLTANPFEPRVGWFYQNNTEKMRLDIGTSVDLLSGFNEKGSYSFGTDFMTYTRLRDQGRFKFPVETTDFFFGVNGVYKFKNLPVSLRMRLAHISSHLSDGYSNDSVLFKKAYVYSREFVDLVAAYQIDDLRLYAGGNFVFSTLPKAVPRVVPQIGFDYKYVLYDNYIKLEGTDNWGTLKNSISFVAGYDFKLMGTDQVRQGANAIQIGFLYNSHGNNGIFLGYFGYFGPSIHGLFYRDYDSYNGLGFQVYFY